MKTLALLALAGLSSFAFAAAPEETASAGHVQSEQYRYGMDLDVAHVIAVSDVSHECGVVPATMTYKDHQGDVHRLEYLVQGGGCSEN
ncbi:DUF2790 domain-containing protein [Aquipseudomonas ullengensis]|uniref:DUF2790 domain-containing protein n=1 Tax=Aquipseudomonas ullengensis TaxID=2759166 RepID=A0A7W4QBF1_9GAMM|nr:DUF2790 domain-containing protein [Pseudomonas ullengensis]MBB2496619.1 DUF2790 domain-containing protein [Pseudomonas ullengensis]